MIGQPGRAVVELRDCGANWTGHRKCLGIDCMHCGNRINSFSCSDSVRVWTMTKYGDTELLLGKSFGERDKSMLHDAQTACTVEIESTASLV